MRNLIFGINVTIDGCCDHTKGIASEEIHDYFTDLFKDVDLIVYGRKTYELMVPFWPDIARNRSGGTRSMNDFATAFDAINKVVFSRSLERIDDENTRLVRSNLKEEISRLKQEPGKNISTGGVDLPSQLIELGLIDEVHIVVHPVIAGEGRRLFDGVNMQEALRMKLVESKIFESGGVALRYVKQ